MRQAGRGGAGPTRDGPEGDHRPGGEHAQEAERGGGPKGVAHVARFQGGSEAAGALEQEPRQALRRLLALLLLPASEARVAAWLRVSALLLAPLSLVSAGSVERGRRERERGQERVMVQDGTCPENARDVLRVQARLLLCRRRRQRRACRARLHLWGVVCHVSCVRVRASQFPKQSWRHRDTHIRRHGQAAQDCMTGQHGPERDGACFHVSGLLTLRPPSRMLAPPYIAWLVHAPCCLCRQKAPGHRVSRPRGTGSVGDSVGEGATCKMEFEVGEARDSRGDTPREARDE